MRTISRAMFALLGYVKIPRPFSHFFALGNLCYFK